MINPQSLNHETKLKCASAGMISVAFKGIYFLFALLKPNNTFIRFSAQVTLEIIIALLEYNNKFSIDEILFVKLGS